MKVLAKGVRVVGMCAAHPGENRLTAPRKRSTLLSTTRGRDAGSTATGPGRGQQRHQQQQQVWLEKSMFGVECMKAWTHGWAYAGAR